MVAILIFIIFFNIYGFVSSLRLSKMQNYRILNYILLSLFVFTGNQLTGQTVPIPEQVQNVPGRTSNATVELVFLANNIPPLGFKSYYVTIASSEGQSRKGQVILEIK